MNSLFLVLLLACFHLFLFLPCSPARPHGHGASQPAEHGQVEHQRADWVGSELRANSGLRLPATPAVLCRHGTLPQTWPPRWEGKKLRCGYISRPRFAHNSLFLSLQWKSPSWALTSPCGGLWSWWRSCVLKRQKSPRLCETCLD